MSEVIARRQFSPGYIGFVFAKCTIEIWKENKSHVRGNCPPPVFAGLYWV